MISRSACLSILTSAGVYV